MTTCYDVVGEKPTWDFDKDNKTWTFHTGTAKVWVDDHEVLRVFRWNVNHNGNECESFSLTLKEAMHRASTMVATYDNLDIIKEFL